MKNMVRTVLVAVTLAALVSVAIAADPPINIGPGGMISNGQVVHGSATYEKGADWGTITTGGSQTVIDYCKFNINNGWTISFVQPDASSAVLNRVISGYGSNIFGNLNSNGQVFIVNPAGVIFGSNSRVDVKRLVASALWMSKTDFLDMMAQDSWNGAMKFSDSYSSCGGGLVWVKPGSRLNADGVYLVGKAVVNQGTMSATDGSPYVVMAAGKNVTIEEPGSSNIAVLIAGTLGDSTYKAGSVTLGAGDIYSTAILDSDLIAMTAQSDIRVAGGLAANGPVEMLARDGGNRVDDSVTGDSVSMEARKDNRVDGDVSGTDSVFIKSGNNADVEGDILSDGDIMTVSLGSSKVGGSVDGSGVTMLAGINNEVGGSVTTDGSDGIVMTAGHDNIVGGNVEAINGDVAMTSICCGNDVGGNVIGENVSMTARTYNRVGVNVDATNGDVMMLAELCYNYVKGDVTGSHVEMTAGTDNHVVGNVTAGGENSVVMTAGWNNIVDGSVEATNGDVTMTATLGRNDVVGNVIGENVAMTARTSNEVGGNVDATDGDVTMLAKWYDNDVDGGVSGSNVNMTAGDDNRVGGSVEALDGDVTIMATWGENDVDVDVTGTNVNMTAKTSNSVGGNVAAAGDVMMLAKWCYNYVGGDVNGSHVDMTAAANNHVVGNVNAGGPDSVVMTAGWNNIVEGSVEATDGDVTMTAIWGKNDVGGDVTGRNVNMTAGASNEVDGSVSATAGDVTMLARWCSNYVGGDVSGNNVNMAAARDNAVVGDVDAVSGAVAINSGNFTILGGNVSAQTDVTIVSGAGVTLNGPSDQTIEAITGKVEISTPLTEKVTDGHLVILGGSPDLSVNLWTAVHTAGGNIEIRGLGDIQLGDYLIAGGSGELPVYHGISVISDTGEIYTDAPGNGINVFMQGGSDQAAGIGVGLPADPAQKAAIVLISDAPLWLGSGAQLVAGGTYYGADGPVDDRAAVKFRDESDWQGVPIDIAVYVQSVSGDVTLDHLGILDIQDLGTVALDAKSRMLLVNETDAGTKGDYYLYRLEVCSRDTIWLSEAIANGTHPFVSDPALMEALMGGGTYVMRGGVNPEDIEGAWVLHEPTPPSLPALLSQPADEGCPAVMLAAAEEIGQDPAMLRNGIFVNAKNLQPCNSCEKLMRSADVLKDADGARLAALGQVLNEFVTTQAPPSPEQMAAINQTMAMHAKDGTAYAAAQEWVDALATYVGIMKSELGLSQDDALAIAVGRYGAPENSNDTVKAFIAQTLAELAG